MNNSSDVFSQIVEIMTPYVRKKRRPLIKRQARVLHDLGVMGDDIDEIGWEIEKRFGLTFAPCELGEYFPGEGEVLGYSGLYHRWTRFRDFKEMTLGEFVAFVEGKISQAREGPAGG